jgi:hypothetical protein
MDREAHLPIDYDVSVYNGEWEIIRNGVTFYFY